MQSRAINMSGFVLVIRKIKTLQFGENQITLVLSKTNGRVLRGAPFDIQRGRGEGAWKFSIKKNLHPLDE